jgi:hypothetical protein
MLSLLARSISSRPLSIRLSPAAFVLLFHFESELLDELDDEDDPLPCVPSS